MSLNARCPKSGGTLKSNGGADSHTHQKAGHILAHSLARGDVIGLGVAAIGSLYRVIHPEKLICPGCGFTCQA